MHSTLPLLHLPQEDFKASQQKDATLEASESLPWGDEVAAGGQIPLAHAALMAASLALSDLLGFSLGDH